MPAPDPSTWAAKLRHARYRLDQEKRAANSRRVTSIQNLAKAEEEMREAKRRVEVAARNLEVVESEIESLDEALAILEEAIEARDIHEIEDSDTDEETKA